MLQALSIQFPGDLNRELFLGNREFCARNREIEQKPALSSRIVLQNSFFITDHKFSGAIRQMCEGPHG